DAGGAVVRLARRGRRRGRALAVHLRRFASPRAAPPRGLRRALPPCPVAASRVPPRGAPGPRRRPRPPGRPLRGLLPRARPLPARRPRPALRRRGGGLPLRRQLPLLFRTGLPPDAGRSEPEALGPRVRRAPAARSPLPPRRGRRRRDPQEALGS